MQPKPGVTLRSQLDLIDHPFQRVGELRPSRSTTCSERSKDLEYEGQIEATGPLPN